MLIKLLISLFFSLYVSAVCPATYHCFALHASTSTGATSAQYISRNRLYSNFHADCSGGTLGCTDTHVQMNVIEARPQIISIIVRISGSLSAARALRASVCRGSGRALLPFLLVERSEMKKSSNIVKYLMHFSLLSNPPGWILPWKQAFVSFSEL